VAIWATSRVDVGHIFSSCPVILLRWYFQAVDSVVHFLPTQLAPETLLIMRVNWLTPYSHSGCNDFDIFVGHCLNLWHKKKWKSMSHSSSSGLVTIKFDLNLNFLISFG
jgi:hypothetical protein